MTTIGVDLGGTQLRASRVDAEGRALAGLRVPTDRTDPGAVIAQIDTMVSSLRDESTRAVGVGIPGTIDPGAGVVLNIPALPGWAAIPLAALLRERLGLPCLLENDAKAATLGEWHAGAGRGFDNFVYVTVSTGIGSAAVVDGRLVRGAGGLAGEIGHTRISDSPVHCACGLTGCWQAIASGAALDREAQRIAAESPSSFIAQLAGTSIATASHVGEAARAKDAGALAVLARYAEYVGYGLANLQHVYSPERIVFGGGASALLDLIQADVELTLRARLLPGFRPASIVRAALLDEAGVVGASFRARDGLGG